MRSVRVLYDHQIFSCQMYGGISRYFAELVKQFGHDSEVECEMAIRFSNNHHLDKRVASSCKSLFKWWNFRGRSRLIFHLNNIVSRKALASGKFDIFHPTYYHPYFLGHLGSRPFVLTVHDLTCRVLASTLRDQVAASERIKLLAQKAARIIAVSESTRNDIVRFLNIDERKIEVIYHGNSLCGLPAVRPPGSCVPSRYLLFVGNRGSYKNFTFFLKATRPLFGEDRELALVCVGGPAFSDSEMHLLRESGLEARVHRFVVGDEALVFLYQGALAMVFPSLYEGFGIPVLEALGCGCPALLSRIGAFVEAAGEAAVYFDPQSETSMREAIRGVIFDEDTRRALRFKGYERARQFSWKETAERTAAVYHALM